MPDLAARFEWLVAAGVVGVGSEVPVSPESEAPQPATRAPRTAITATRERLIGRVYAYNIGKNDFPYRGLKP